MSPMPKNKIVAQVLNELGLCKDENTDKLPEGWRQRVEKALAKRGVEVHMTTIYEVRRKEVAKHLWERLQEEAKHNALPPQPARLPAALPPQAPTISETIAKQIEKIDWSQKMTVADAIAIKEFAVKYGGLKGLSEAVALVEKVVS